MKTMKQEKKIGSTVEQLVKWHEEGVAYQTALGLRTTIPQCVRFYEGDQWEVPTKDTKHFPRPVINIIEMICNNKKSQVLSSPVKLVYKSEAREANIEKFNRFVEYEQSRLRQSDINNKAVLDGIIKGSYCFYYFWDSEVVGLDGLVEGDIGLQLIDPLDVHFADPKEKDEQKQDWIMLVSREDVEKIKRIADKGVDASRITDDDNESIYNEVESDTTKYATVLTRFFRHNGEVYFERSTRQVIFCEARPFTPNVKHNKNTIEGVKDEQEEVKPEDEYLKNKPRATVYPIVFKSWKERDKSIYGRGEVENIIPNQKAINWNWGLQLLVAQDEGFGKWKVSPDALKGQQITNAPGQVLTDYSKTGNGIHRIQTQSMSQGSMNISDKLSDVTRVVTGSSEIMNGELISSGMSGAAIAQLQAQALKPIEDLQKGFWRSMEKAGEVLEQYLRFFFTDKKFQYETDESQKKAMPGALPQNTPTEPEYVKDTFNSKEYEGTRFDVVAEAVAGTVMSDVADINILDNLFGKGAISIKTYITCYPQNAIANRQKLLEAIDSEQQDVIQQLTMQLQQAQAQLEQAAATLQAQEKAIAGAKSFKEENESLKIAYAELRAEYTEKIKAANEILKGLGARTKEYYSDAKEFAGEIAKQRGGAEQNQVNKGDIKP